MKSWRAASGYIVSTARLGAALVAVALAAGPRASHAEPAEEIAALNQKLSVYSREQKLLHARLSLTGLARVDPSALRFADAPLRSNGRPMLVHLWSVHCPPCLKEMPALAQIMSHLYEESELRAVFIAEDLPGELAEYLRASAAQLPKVEHWMSGSASSLRIELRDTSQPLTLLLDGNLTVRQAFVGSLADRRNELYSTVSRLLRSLPAHPAKS